MEYLHVMISSKMIHDITNVYILISYNDSYNNINPVYISCKRKMQIAIADVTANQKRQ